MKKPLIMLILGLLCCNISLADITVSDYLKFREGKNKKVNEFIDNNILGIGTGIFWSNINIGLKLGKANKEKPIYCAPEKLTITKENYINFLDAEIKEHKKMRVLSGDTPIAIMILFHLERIFPCK